VIASSRILVSKWLRQEVDRAGLHRLHGHRDVAVPVMKMMGTGLLILAELALQVQPAQTRQPERPGRGKPGLRPDVQLPRKSCAVANVWTRESDGLDELFGGVPESTARRPRHRRRPGRCARALALNPPDAS